MMLNHSLSIFDVTAPAAKLIRSEQSGVSASVIVRHENIRQNEEGCNRQSVAIDECMEKENVEDDRRYHDCCERDEITGHEGNAAKELSDLQKRHEKADRFEPFGKRFDGAGQFRLRKQIEKYNDGSKKKKQSHQGSDNDHRDFHRVLIYR